jgi:adenylate cyclase
VAETRKLAAILVSDVVGYSRLAGADEDRILARLRTLRSDLIDPIISVHHGRIVKRTGDGSIIEFRSVVDAVRCAIEVQNAMVERNAGVPEDRRIVFRIGIHLGDVVEESDGDLMGDGVNIAARLEGIAKPGAICLSEDAYRQVSGRLDMEVTDLGPTQLKNIERPIRAYSLQVGVPAQAKPTEMKPPAPKKPSRLTLLGAGVAALLVLIAGAWYFLATNHAKSPAEPAHLSIVVLPFANLSGDPAQDYLVDALTDELTTAVSRIQGSFVIARNTASTYKGKAIDAKAIGKDLGVRYVLEGSVQPSGDQVRVNAQLIDADSGAHVWAEQFDTPRAGLLQMQDEIVTHLARAMYIQLPEAEGARLKRTPAASPDAEDLALQCHATAIKSGYVVKEDYRLCEQALAIDANNVRAMAFLAVRYYVQAYLGLSADPKADLKRADELNSRALALDPNWAGPHLSKANILATQGRFDEAIPESQRSLALDPAEDYANANLAWDYAGLGQFEKALEYEDKAIRLSPRDPYLFGWLEFKSWVYIGLKRYDQAIDLARQSLSLSPNFPHAHRDLIAALALSGRDAEAREALQRYLALPPAGLRTIAAWTAFSAQSTNEHSDPRLLDYWDRMIEGLRKAGMPEE